MTDALPQESVEQSCPSKDNTEQIHKLSGMVQGLQEALEEIKNDMSLQVRCLCYFSQKYLCMFSVLWAKNNGNLQCDYTKRVT